MIEDHSKIRRCTCCGNQIPFEDARVSEAVAAKIRSFVRSGKVITAITELKDLANISLSEAKYWVDHCGEAIGKGLITGPCPYCGVELRTSDAKQCRHCKRDWHDPNNILILGTSERFIEEA